VELQFTEEQQQPSPQCAEFAEVNRAARDGVGRSVAFPMEIVPKLAEMGLARRYFPEQYGGAGWGTSKCAGD